MRAVEEYTMTSADSRGDLAGNTIKEVFGHADQVADLHACRTSRRGDYFRFRLLQQMESPMGEEAAERMRVESGVNEYHRHLHMLLRHRLARLVDGDGASSLVRTDLGESAVNAVRELERRIGVAQARSIYCASLGPNCLRLFLRIYGDTGKASWEHLQVTYSPADIARLALFLPRAIDGISAVDTLNEAQLVVYREDNRVYMQATRARAFYHYLKELYAIVLVNGRLPGHVPLRSIGHFDEALP